MKQLTLDQVERRRQQAVDFLRDVVGDPDRASDFDEMTAEEYAEHRGDIEVIDNPNRRRNTTMATKAELEERIAELEDELEERDQILDSIDKIVSPQDAAEDDEYDDDPEAEYEDDPEGED